VLLSLRYRGGASHLLELGCASNRVFATDGALHSVVCASFASDQDSYDETALKLAKADECGRFGSFGCR
jgi:hypothetical protein